MNPQSQSPLGKSYLHDLETFIESPDLTPKERLAKLQQLDEHLDYILSSNKVFPGNRKKLNNAFKLVFKEIEQDPEHTHALAEKCHSMLCRVREKDPDVIDVNLIPAKISEAHYDYAPPSPTDYPSVLDLICLADTSKKDAVEKDFVKFITQQKYPIAENSQELVNTYWILSIAAQKKYANLAVACLNKLTTTQIMMFLSATYGPEKDTVKNYIINNLKEIHKEHPDTYDRIIKKMETFIATDLDQAKPWNDFQLRLAEDVMDVALGINAPSILQKIYDAVKKVNYQNPEPLIKLCEAGHFPAFAGQFALYYTLAKNFHPEDFTKVNGLLNELISSIISNRKLPAKKSEEFYIPPSDDRFLKQLIQPIVDYQNWRESTSTTTPVPAIHITSSKLNKDDVHELAKLNPKEITIPKTVVSRLANQRSLLGYLFSGLDFSAGLSELKKLLPEDAIITTT